MISDDASGDGGVRAARAARPAGDPRFRRQPRARARAAPTRTSPGRWRWSRPTPRTSPSATRTTAGTRTSSRPCSARSATRAMVVQRHARSTARRRRADLRHLLDRRGCRTTTASPRCCSATRSPAPPRCFARELLDDALPLPPRAGNLYHDHWLALVAAATRPDRLRRPAALRLRPARGRRDRPRRRQPRRRRRRPAAAARRPARPRAGRPARRVAADLLRRVLPHGADRRRARAAPRRRDRRRRRRALRLRARARPLARRARAGSPLASCAASSATTPAAARRGCCAGSPGDAACA